MREAVGVGQLLAGITLAAKVGRLVKKCYQAGRLAVLEAQ